METLIFSLSFALLILSGVETTTFTFHNNCPYTVWPGTLTGSGKPQLSSTGFELTSGGSSSLDTQAPWSGRFWGRTLCSTDSAQKFSCGTADCASGQVACNGAGAVPPATLIELTLAENSGQDNYDVSLVDGFNLPMSISSTGGTGDCRDPSCPKDVNAVCPEELAVKGSNGGVIACKSACTAFNKPEYCCTDDHNTMETCPPTNYSQIFKTQCPQAYSYAYDDKSSLVTCNGGPNYIITFCPQI